MLAPARSNPSCSRFLMSGAISSLEAVSQLLRFQNFCRNYCWRRRSVCLAVPLAAYRVSVPSPREGLLGQEEPALPARRLLPGTTSTT